MNKIILVTLLVSGLCIGGAADAKSKNKRKPSSTKPVVCKLDVQDSTLSVTFTELNFKKPKVSLYEPSGEFQGKSFKGECTHDEGADELSISCNVNTSTDSGYDVHLASTGGPEMIAQVAHWTMSGKDKPQTLPCSK